MDENCDLPLLPSAMAPNTKIPDSLMTQSGWKSSPFRSGRRWGSRSSRNTLASTSSAAAEHFPTLKRKAKRYTPLHLPAPWTNNDSRDILDRCMCIFLLISSLVANVKVKITRMMWLTAKKKKKSEWGGVTLYAAVHHGVINNANFGSL